MKKGWMVGALVVTSSWAMAGPSGLGLMPIADILKHRECQFSTGATGFERSINKGFAYQHGLLVGVLNVAEVGYDNDFVGNTVYNAKYQIFDESKVKDYALSVGTQNFANGKGDVYVVGRHDLKNGRLHLGAIHSDEYHPLVGWDQNGGGGTLQLEFVAGRDARFTASVVTAIKQVSGLQLMYGFSVPADHRNGAQYFGQLIYSSRF